MKLCGIMKKIFEHQEWGMHGETFNVNLFKQENRLSNLLPKFFCSACLLKVS